MLRIVFDIYSGRQNPYAIIADEVEATALIREISKDRGQLTDGPPADAGLGFRGVFVEPLSDDVSDQADLPSSFYIPLAAARSGRIGEHLEKLIALSQKGTPAGFDSTDELTLLAPVLREQIGGGGRVTVQDSSRSSPVAPPPPDDTFDVTCTIEFGTFNPGFWNNDATVRSNNNCYNYASNKRTNTFAQPGRGSGHMYTAINCAEVSRGALSDGVHRRFDCFPDGEKPRWLMALVIAPAGPQQDYHWYRKSKEGFWGHKPGGTPAKNVDNSNRVITNPETCDRGPYTIFCGYFYACKSQRIK